MTIEDDDDALEFYGPIRPLSWELRASKRTHNTVEDDDCTGPSSFIWPDDPDERTVIPFLLSLNEYVVLATCIDVGRDIAYPFTSERVTWLWLRNFRCEVEMPCCDDILSAIAELSAAQEANAQIVAGQLADMRNASAYQYRLHLDSIYESGNPSSIDGNLSSETHNWTDSHYDEAVLCSALMAFVYAWAQAKANELRAQIDTTSAITAAIFALSITGLEFFAIPVTGLALATGAIPDIITKLMQITALTDTVALDNVVCQMQEIMGPQEINSGTFSLALSSAEFEVGSNAEIVATLMSSALGDNYLVFLAFFGIAYQRFESDLEPAIDCPNCGQFDPHTLHIVNHEGNPYPGTITFMGSAGTEEYWDVVTAQLPNTYWYMSIQDADGKTFTIVNVELIAGEFGEWSIVTPSGTVTPDTLEEAFGLDVIQPDLYITPGPQGHVLLTLQELLPTWETITSGELPTGTITDQDATSVSVTSGFDTGTDRIWLRRTDLTPFEVDTISEGGGAITTYQWFDDTFTEHLTPIAHGDIVTEIYYESTSSAFSIEITIVAP